jgi:hypothetical protein
VEYKHPHFGATYRIRQREDGTFAVEVAIPDRQTATVTSFASRAAAKRWIDRHKEVVAKGDPWKHRPSFRELRATEQPAGPSKSHRTGGGGG